MSSEKNSPFLSPVEEIRDEILHARKLRLWMKRDELLAEDDDQAYCGNKWRKLKYNLIQAKEEGHSTLLTFGGAYSNHIAALASAGKQHGFSTIGLIRGERIEPLNPTLSYAEKLGMHLHFVSRGTYREKERPFFLQQLQASFGPCYIIPEGGSNRLALKGAAELGREMAQQLGRPPEYVAVCCGTGGTMAGIIAGSDPDTHVLGFPILKGDFLGQVVKNLLLDYGKKNRDNWSMQTAYHYGGYAKFKPELIRFINAFAEKTGIPLDPIYTGKMMYGLWDLIQKGFFPENSRIVAVHSGGLQGIAGFNERFGKIIKKGRL